MAQDQLEYIYCTREQRKTQTWSLYYSPKALGTHLHIDFYIDLYFKNLLNFRRSRNFDSETLGMVKTVVIFFILHGIWSNKFMLKNC